MHKIRVQMPKGTTGVSVCGQSYDVGEDGIVEVDHAEHVAPLVESGGVELGEGDEPGSLSALFGSSTLPPVIEIEGREPLQLGDLVRDVFSRTEISVDEWNNLPVRVRDILLGYGLAALTGALDSPALQDANARIAELTEKLAQAEARLDQVQDLVEDKQEEPEAEAEAEPETEKPAPEKPDFANMTKARISDWVVANGGTAIPAGDHASHVAAAEAHWAGMQEG